MSNNITKELLPRSLPTSTTSTHCHGAHQKAAASHTTLAAMEASKRRRCGEKLESIIAKANVTSAQALLTVLRPSKESTKDDAADGRMGTHVVSIHRGDDADDMTHDYCFALLKENMSDMYGDEWSDAEKHEELRDEEARLLLLSAQSDHTKDSIVEHCGFAHIRFVMEEGAAVLYVYELQLESKCRRTGVGKSVMANLETLAKYLSLQGIILTCFKHNKAAMAFYNALGYQIDSISPSRCDPEGVNECNYEILSRIWDATAQAQLDAVQREAAASSSLARAVARGDVTEVNGTPVEMGEDGVVRFVTKSSDAESDGADRQ